MGTAFTVAEVYREFQAVGVLSEVIGNENTNLTKIVAIEDAGPGTLAFVDKPEYLDLVKTKMPSAVVAGPKLKEALSKLGTVILIAPNVSLAHALIKQRFGARDFARSGWSGVHPSAIVHESVTLAAGVVVEPRAVIGANTKIESGVRIMAGVVIENDVQIGANSIIHPGAVIGYGSQLGQDVVIGPGTIIGSEGFGFAQDAKRKSHAIPQTGIVVLEDRVRLGANCCVDRAAYRETRIRQGTKLDNLCHVAHNVQIGEDCLLTAMLCVAGSTKIGDRVITSGQTGIIDHLEITKDVVLLHRAGVTKSVDKPGAYAGLPLLPLGDYMKMHAVLRGAVELRQRLTDAEKALGIERE